MSDSTTELLCQLVKTDLRNYHKGQVEGLGYYASRILWGGHTEHPTIINFVFEAIGNERLESAGSVNRFFNAVGLLSNHFDLLSTPQIDHLIDRLLYVMNLGRIYDPYPNPRQEPNRFTAASYLIDLARFDPNNSNVQDLVSAVEEGRLRTISENYPFYVKLGKSGTEEVLINALDRHFTRQMALDLLNCGNTKVEEGAKQVCTKKGLDVFEREGVHRGPRWGGGA